MNQRAVRSAAGDAAAGAAAAGDTAAGTPGPTGAASRRRVALGGIAAGAAALLAACAGGGTSPAARPADLKGASVEFWTWNPATHPESLGTQKVMSDFASRNPQG